MTIVTYSISHPPKLVSFHEESLPSSFITAVPEKEEIRVCSAYQEYYKNLLQSICKVRQIFVTSKRFDQVVSTNTRFILCQLEIIVKNALLSLQKLSKTQVIADYSSYRDKLIHLVNAFRVYENKLEQLIWLLSNRFCVWAIPDLPPSKFF